MDTSTSGLSSPQQSDEIVVANKNSSELDEPPSAPATKTAPTTTTSTLMQVDHPISNGDGNDAATGTSSLSSNGDTESRTNAAHIESTAAPKPDNLKITPSTNGNMPSIPIPNTHTPNTTPHSATRGRGRSSGRGRGGRQRGSTRGGTRGGKRKRNTSNPNDDNNDDEDDDNDDDDTSDSEVYTPLTTQTKSGRSITKPTTFVPPPPPNTHQHIPQTNPQTASGASPTGPTAAAAAAAAGGGAATSTAPHKRKRVYRRNPEAAVCKVCLRGTSPASNMIVFCDGCNSAYHRYCHHPPIDQSVVDQLDKEWFCLACEQDRAVSLAPSAIVDVSEYVAVGTSIPDNDRRRFFSTQTYGTLVSLLTASTTLHPSLPVFTRDFRDKGRIDDAVAAGFDAKAAPPAAAKDERVVVPLEHPAHYPRPGFGFMQTLPPDREDSHHLVDEEDCYGVFSHVYQTDANAANNAFLTKANSKKARN